MMDGEIGNAKQNICILHCGSFPAPHNNNAPFPQRDAMCKALCATALAWLGLTPSSWINRRISLALFFMDMDKRMSHSGGATEFMIGRSIDSLIVSYFLPSNWFVYYSMA